MYYSILVFLSRVHLCAFFCLHTWLCRRKECVNWNASWLLILDIQTRYLVFNMVTLFSHERTSGSQIVLWQLPIASSWHYVRTQMALTRLPYKEKQLLLLICQVSRYCCLISRCSVRVPYAYRKDKSNKSTLTTQPLSPGISARAFHLLMQIFLVFFCANTLQESHIAIFDLCHQYHLCSVKASCSDCLRSK